MKRAFFIGMTVQALIVSGLMYWELVHVSPGQQLIAAGFFALCSLLA